MADIHIGIILALVSAVTTAITHALLKAGNNKLAIRTWISILCFLFVLPVAWIVGSPPSYLWPWLLISAALHAVYQFALIWSYDVSNFSVAFPVARGVSPIFAAILGIAFLGDFLSLVTMLGIAIVCLGILGVAAYGKMSFTGFVAAIITGLLTSIYTAVDAHSVRIAPTALTFIAWSYILEVVAMPTLFLYRHGHEAIEVLRPDFRMGVIAAIGTLVSFGAALFALSFAPVGIVSALRELSVLAGLIIAVLFLKERIDTKLLFGGLAVVVGAIFIVTGI